ncbi:Dual specificity protein phosphatase 10, partial [Modicella reniformis]
MTSCHYSIPESPSPLQLTFASPTLLSTTSSASLSVGSSASTLASTPTAMSTSTTTCPVSPPVPLVRPASHSFSSQRPLLLQDVKKPRNSKRLSLMVAPSPGKLEHLASIAAAATVAASSPSFPPSTPSFSKRHFTSAPLTSSLATIPSQSPATSPAATPTTILTIEPADEGTNEFSSKRQSRSVNTQPKQRPISAYFADFSAECGTASPYTKEPVCVLPHLYLGAEHNATDVNILLRLGITAVLNVAIEISNVAQQQQYQVPASPTFSSSSSSGPEKMITVIGGDRIVKTAHGCSIHYKNLSWTHHQRNLLSEFPKAFAFIEDTKDMGGKVLVHCQLGVSRSASLVIAYVMKTLQMKLTDAYEFVKSRSSVISPNLSLMYQLAEFGKSLERPSMAMTTPTSATANKRDEYDDNYDDLEDGYPYPTDRMDLDGEEAPTMIAVKPAASPAMTTTRSTTTKRATLVLARSSLRSGDATAPLLEQTSARTRSSLKRSPLTPMNLNAAATAPAHAAIPKTPMTDRFSFSDATMMIPPTTPMTDRFSFASPFASSNLPVHPLSMKPQQQFPEGVFMPIDDLSPPVPPFLASHRDSSSSTTTSSSGSSSFTNSTAPTMYSRASSMSSAVSICDSPSEIVPPNLMVLTPAPAVFTTSSINGGGNGDGPLWSKLPATPTRTYSGMSVSSSCSSSSQKKQPKKAGIHALAKVLTRPWSRNSCKQQQPQQQPQQQQVQSSNGMECLMYDVTTTDITTTTTNNNNNNNNQLNEAQVVVPSTASASSDLIFSPRPCSPSSLENKSFGDLCQALRVE